MANDNTNMMRKNCLDGSAQVIRNVVTVKQISHILCHVTLVSVISDFSSDVCVNLLHNRKLTKWCTKQTSNKQEQRNSWRRLRGRCVKCCYWLLSHHQIPSRIFFGTDSACGSQIDVLQAEVTALKTLVLTSTPSSPNRQLHPQLQPSGSRGTHKHIRNKSASGTFPPSPVKPEPASVSVSAKEDRDVSWNLRTSLSSACLLSLQHRICAVDSLLSLTPVSRTNVCLTSVLPLCCS